MFCGFFTVIQARNAWIQADETRYKSKYKCTLWKEFASRGLGVNADVNTEVLNEEYKNDYVVPQGC